MNENRPGTYIPLGPEMLLTFELDIINPVVFTFLSVAVLLYFFFFVFSFFFFSIPFIVFALPSSLPPSRKTDPGSHNRHVLLQCFRMFVS